MNKVLICRCEDVLLSDIEDAIATGNEDVESLKRYTGFGTGVCQGKSCVAHVARVLCERTGMPFDRAKPFTARPPVAPIPLRLLAAAGEVTEPEIRGKK
jgi:sarcosine oxidase, subunit beta